MCLVGCCGLEGGQRMDQARCKGGKRHCHKPRYWKGGTPTVKSQHKSTSTFGSIRRLDPCTRLSIEPEVGF